jgi:hypothetical protein
LPCHFNQKGKKRKTVAKKKVAALLKTFQMPLEVGDVCHFREHILRSGPNPASRNLRLEKRKNHGYKDSLLLRLIASPSPSFFLSIDISITPQTTRTLYNDRKRRTQGNSLLLIVLSFFGFPCLTLAFCVIAPFFS